MITIVSVYQGVRYWVLGAGIVWSMCFNASAQIPSDSTAMGKAVYQQVIQFADSRSRTILQTELLFNKEVSLYYSKATDTRSDTAQSDVKFINLVKDVDVTVYRRHNDGLVISREYVLNRLLTVSDTLNALPWQLGDQSRKIGQFNCQNATVPFRGRTYEAWFTAEIPVSNGPWKLSGLPGLIVEASDTEKEIVFNLVSVNYPLADPLTIRPLSADNSVPYAAYRKQLDDKLRNMGKLLRGAASSAGTNYEVGVTTRPSLLERSPQ